MTQKIRAAIIDTDFAFKIGKYESQDLIAEILPKLVNRLYVHKHVYDNEILTPKRVKDQLDKLISNGKALKIDRPEVASISPQKASIYDATIQLLQSQDISTRVGRKNWGEIVSLAAAKALNIPVLLSDESRLQELIDETINSGTATDESPETGDIKIFRIYDFICFMRDLQYDRRAALWIWLNSGRKEEALFRKQQFQKNIWPTQ